MNVMAMARPATIWMFWAGAELRGFAVETEEVEREHEQRVAQGHVEAVAEVGFHNEGECAEPGGAGNARMTGGRRTG